MSTGSASNAFLSASSDANIVLQTESPQPSRPKLSRTSTHKLRTGCITCKKRHIKCDEATPHCNNCLKSRGHCEGYVAKPKKKAPGPVELCWDSRQTVSRAPPQIQKQIDVDSLDFRDATSMLYFQEFVGLVQGPWTSAVSSGDLWEVTLPQLARNNSALRHAAMAIGALCRWHHQSTSQSLRAVSVPAAPTPERDSHYFRAVAHYCHSLKLQSQGASVQGAVFLSVLLLFFEALRGNRKAALDHVNHGLALLLNLLTDSDAHRLVADVAPNPKPLLGAVADIFTPLATQARMVLRGRVGHGPPLPNLAKGLKSKQHTMDSFLVLLSQLPRSSTATSGIPTAFTTLDEFEQHWAAARRRQTSLAPIMIDLMRASGVLDSHDPAIITRFYHSLLHHPRILAFCSSTRETLQALDTAFLPLFTATLAFTPPPSPPALRTLHLRLQLLGVSLFEDAPQFASAATLAARTPLFHEFLSLAAAAVHGAARAAANPAHRLSLQCGLAWHLLAAALLCRDAGARDRAVALLRDYPAQDGVLSVRALHALAARNRGVEAANAVEGTAEERWARLGRREFVFEEAGERVVFRFLERDRGTGVWGPVEEVAEVAEVAEVMRWRRQPLSGSGGLLMADLSLS